MNPLLTIEQASELLHLAVNTIRCYCSQRKMPYYKIGKHLMFDNTEVLNWQRSFRVKTLQEIQIEANNYCITNK